MKVETMGRALIVIGAVVMLYAQLAMPTALPGADFVNIHLISERQNTLILGGLLFFAGIVLFAVFKMKQTKEEADAEEVLATARKESQKAKVEQSGRFLMRVVEKIKSSFKNGWRDHGIARLTNAVFVTLYVPILTPRGASDFFLVMLVVPLALAFREGQANRMVLQLHILAISIFILEAVFGNAEPIGVILIPAVSLPLMAHAWFKLRRAP
jgi:hypothetical protein